MKQEQLCKLLDELVAQSEGEWLEFKHNNHSSKGIGERISALSNGACLNGNDYGYLVFGIEDETRKIVGTKFSPKKTKKGNEELENWLNQHLKPRVDFKIYEFEYNDKLIVIFKIPSAYNQPVVFTNVAYVRIGSITRKLSDFPDKERKIWEKRTNKVFEKEIALADLSQSDIFKLLNTQVYFDLINKPVPTSQAGVIEKFIAEALIERLSDLYSITNLGALLFAKDLRTFPSVANKGIRVIVYDGKNKVKIIRQQNGTKGYAIGFESLINWVNGQLPANEEIGKAFRVDKRMYPERAIREIIANSLVHQHIDEGDSPKIEIFSDRIEFTSHGLPLIKVDRFIDEDKSRNEVLVEIMRKFRICDKLGSGFDRIINECEHFQLPAPKILTQQHHTKVILFAYQELNEMDKNDKIRACFQHSCLRYVSNEKMTNESLRNRFKIEQKNSASASRIIKDTVNEGKIKPEDEESKSKKYKKYIPYWA